MLLIKYEDQRKHLFKFLYEHIFGIIKKRKTSFKAAWEQTALQNEQGTKEQQQHCKLVEGTSLDSCNYRAVNFDLSILASPALLHS